MQNKDKDYNIKVDKNEGTWVNRVLIFTPTRGRVRMEWVQARFGQMIPTNWSHVELIQWMSSYMPMEYQLADAQNLMAKLVVEHDYEYVLYIEDDNLPPPDGFIKMNNYIREGKVPVVSGIYFTKGYPSEPLIYRGRGNSFFKDWKIGDKVWCDGLPFGFRLEHAGMIKAAWEESPEYRVGDQVTRRVFESPTLQYYDPEKGGVSSTQGTTDLAWCTRIMRDKLLEKAGFPEIQKKEFPFLCDTSIFVHHIDDSGVKHPDQQSLQPYLPNNKEEDGKRP